ncbi:envelope biogenesis factor ElyC [Planctobacterium marinum]|uniref:Membrane protein n=1 Tax=Planctobacterium marinum TaxID=1631968 RepID=A0AA48HUY6_9ALTE|nr:membrane protein [Planctobacterium marinum]
MLSFTIKKWLGALLQPLPLILILLLITLFLFLRGKKRTAIGVQSIAILFFIAVTTPPFANFSARAIEANIVQFDNAKVLDYIVVLGCGHVNDRRVPITSQVDSCSLYRVVEGVRIFQSHPNTKLVFTGFGGNQPLSNAETNKELALALGVPDYRILTYSTPKDTREEAQVLTPILKDKQFALVTEASHMPRALLYFQQQGLTPIPAPTAHLYRDEGPLLSYQYLPDAHYLHKTERAVYEYIGQLWQKIAH